MKHSALTFFLFLSFIFCKAQRSAVELINNNFLYAGIKNPIWIAVENTSNNLLSFNVSNGKITKEKDRYYFFTEQSGSTEIILFKKQGGKLRLIGRRSYRVKPIPNPIFKIGSGRDKVSKGELASQQFVRAELEGFDYDVRFIVDSFTVRMFFTETCRYVERTIHGNKISEDLKSDFSSLKPDDILIFKNIVAKGPDGVRNLNSILVKIIE